MISKNYNRDWGRIPNSNKSCIPLVEQDFPLKGFGKDMWQDRY